MIEGLSHITFIVRDMDRMEKILTTVLGATRLYDSGNAFFSTSRERFFLAGGLWIAIMEGASLPNRTYDHIAFRIDESSYDACLQNIRALNLTLRDDRQRVDGEARSIYFYDDDNHLFELHTGNLDERLSAYDKRIPHVTP